jgi:hypothetical protein
MRTPHARRFFKFWDVWDLAAHHAGPARPARHDLWRVGATVYIIIQGFCFAIVFAGLPIIEAQSFNLTAQPVE